MTAKKHYGIALLAITLLGPVAISASCSSVETSRCTPGESKACAGPKGCQGFQACRADGAAFEACNCDGATSSSAGPSGATSTGSTVATATGAGGGSSSSSTGASSTSGSGGAGGAGSFTPADLPGLVLWLEGDSGVVADPQHPGTLLHWLDQSGNGNDATAMGLQDGYRFNIDPAVIHGHDAIGCPGNGTRIEVPDVPSLRFGTGEYAVAVVARKSALANGTFKSLYEKDGGNGVRMGFGTDFQLYQANTTVSLADPDPTKFHAIVGRGPSLRLSTLGANVTGPTASGNVDAVGWPIYLCTNGGADGQDLAEVVVVKGALSDANLTKLQGYFQTKFNL